MGNEKVTAQFIGIIAIVVGFFTLLQGIEIWRIFGTTRYVITDIGYLGVLAIIIGFVFILASFFLKPDTHPQPYMRAPQSENPPSSCPQCGKPLVKDANYCRFCGARIR